MRTGEQRKTLVRRAIRGKIRLDDGSRTSLPASDQAIFGGEDEPPLPDVPAVLPVPVVVVATANHRQAGRQQQSEQARN